MRSATQYLKSSQPTPHMVVIDRGGRVVYMGAIDDTPPTRLADVKTAHNSVAAALDAIVAGQPVAVASTRAQHVAGDDKKVGRIARQAVNCRDYHNVTMAECGHQLS